MKPFVIKHKRGLLLGLILLFVVLLCVSIHYYNLQVIDATKESLQLLANEKAEQVNLFLELKKEELLLLGSMDVFKEAILYPNDSSKIGMARDHINELKGVIPGISILTKEGIVLVGDVDLPGTDYSGQPYFSLAEKKIVFERYYDPLRKGDYYAIVGPVYDNQEKNKIIGTIAFDIELNKISEIMTENQEKETTEVYLIDGTGLLLSASKFVDQNNTKGVLIQTITSEGAKECLADLKKYDQGGYIKEHAEEVPRYLNYMGNEVYGAHAYLPVIGVCVIAESAS
jgi:C4-dicarboxylate-specific signal transduction histidine kinase